LPGLFALVLIVATAGFTVAAYRAESSAVLAAAQLRLRSAAAELVQISAGNATDRGVNRAAAAAGLPEVRAFLRAPATSPAEPVRTALRRVAGDTTQTLALELFDPSGRPLLAVDSFVELPVTVPGRSDSIGVGPLYIRDDHIGYVIDAPVRSGDALLGRLVLVRRLATSAPAVDRIGQLIGSDAVILVGNRDGSVWTDFRREVHRPPPSDSISRYVREGTMRLSASAAIPGTPWTFAVEFPATSVFAPLRVLLATLLGIAAGVLMVGTLVGWLLSRRITRPILQLSTAADAVTRGDYSHPVATERTDEIGSLSRSFATMAKSVHRSQDRLEHEVADRTRELQTALGELEAAQADLVRQERLAMLGQLSSSVGHELRNPLGVMTNAIYYLNATLKEMPPKVREYLDILGTQVRLSEKIVADLLDFARVRPPERSHADLPRLVTEQLARVEIPAGVEVVKEFPASLPPAHVDAVQVGQVLLNLFTNGVQAMEGRGRLTVRGSATNGTVALMVQDTGPGVPEGHLERIFEPLFTTKARGIGLGLSVSRLLARANGGELQVESPPGQGATFILTMPVESTT
jgi:signal transduction histidine kinase